MEERQTRLLELRAMLDDEAELPSPQILDQDVSDRTKAYQKSQERLQWTERWWERAKRWKMDALSGTKDPWKALSAIKESRRAEQQRNERRIEAVSSSYRVDEAMSQRKMRDVIAWQQAMAPMRIEELEQEIKALEGTIRDVDRIMCRPQDSVEYSGEHSRHESNKERGYGSCEVVDLSWMNDTDSESC